MATGTAADVVMPQMGVSVSEGTITKWLKSEGDPVAADEPLLEISTDKVDTEVPAPASGVLGPILVPEGETVDVGTPLATIVPAGAEAAGTDDTGPSASASEAPVEEPAAEALAEPEARPTPEPAATPSADDKGNGGGRAFVSPVVARIAGEHDIDVSLVAGTGRGGRVTKRDILDFIETSGGKPAGGAEPARDVPPHLVPPTPAAPGRRQRNRRRPPLRRQPLRRRPLRRRPVSPRRESRSSR